MPPAVGRPWLVTLRSTMKSAIPTRIRITPIAGGITIMGNVPFGRSAEIRLRIASEVRSDCTAHRGEDFGQSCGLPSPAHRAAGHRIAGPFGATLKATRPTKRVVMYPLPAAGRSFGQYTLESGKELCGTIMRADDYV